MKLKLLHDILLKVDELEKQGEKARAEAWKEVLEEEVHPKAKQRGEDKWFKKEKHGR